MQTCLCAIVGVRGGHHTHHCGDLRIAHHYRGEGGVMQTCLCAIVGGMGVDHTDL